MGDKSKIFDLIIGFFIGVLSSILGCFLFITFVMKQDFIAGLNDINAQGYLGKIMTLGAIMNVVVFFILLKYNKDIIARGVILATIILTVITLFV